MARQKAFFPFNSTSTAAPICTSGRMPKNLFNTDYSAASLKSRR
jgi:hypothetical protein